MNIGSGNGYPSSALSNFAPHRFEVDGITCYSMEGFLQSLKFSSVDMQKYVCTLVGKAAKYKGKKKNWWTSQTLYWKEQEIKRESPEYQQLLNKAYRAMFDQAESFRKALWAAGKDAVFSHSMGKSNERETVLTEREFTSRLMYLKEELFRLSTIK